MVGPYNVSWHGTSYFLTLLGVQQYYGSDPIAIHRGCLKEYIIYGKIANGSSIERYFALFFFFLFIFTPLGPCDRDTSIFYTPVVLEWEATSR